MFADDQIMTIAIGKRLRAISLCFFIRVDIYGLTPMICDDKLTGCTSDNGQLGYCLGQAFINEDSLSVLEISETIP